MVEGRRETGSGQATPGQRPPRSSDGPPARAGAGRAAYQDRSAARGGSGSTPRRGAPAAGGAGRREGRAGTGRPTERPFAAGRPERGVRRPMSIDPALPDDVLPSELPREARAELRTVSKETADLVARHLAMAGMLIGDDPRAAYAHAQAARRRLPRIAVVREAVGLCAYANGEWAEALAELRASKRINGSADHLAVMADCERGLGRPERALALASGPEARGLDREAAVEMRIVVSGARRDLGQPEAAVVSLQGADLNPDRRDPWSARLFYAYAEALLAAGRAVEARQWFVHAAVADDEGGTDAMERVDRLDGVVLDDAQSETAETETAETETAETETTEIETAETETTEIETAENRIVERDQRFSTVTLFLEGDIRG
jgi:hypothetical protein